MMSKKQVANRLILIASDPARQFSAYGPQWNQQGEQQGAHILLPVDTIPSNPARKLTLLEERDIVRIALKTILDFERRQMLTDPSVEQMRVLQLDSEHHVPINGVRYHFVHCRVRATSSHDQRLILEMRGRKTVRTRVGRLLQVALAEAIENHDRAPRSVVNAA